MSTTLSQVCRKLREHRLGNTATSIVLGFDPANYETDAQSRQRDAFGAPKANSTDTKAMRKMLTATHFVLGNEHLDYKTVATLQDPTGRMRDFMAESVATDARKSSCYLGSEKPCYSTTSQDNADADLFTASRNGEVRQAALRLKDELTQHNFELGSEARSLSTTSREAFKYDEATARSSRGKLIEAQKIELRRQHFELGLEKVLYESDLQSSMRCGEISRRRLFEMEQDAAAAKELKRKLLATNVVIGDDPEYFS